MVRAFILVLIAILNFSFTIQQEINDQLTLKYDYKIKEKQTVKLKCPIVINDTDDALVIIEWYKNSVKITPAFYRYKVNDNYLQIRNANYHDSGVYVCKMSNGFNSVTANVSLFVNSSKNDLVMKMKIDEKNSRLKDTLAPKFINNDKQQEKQIKKIKGESLKLKCRITNQENSDIVWYKNDEALNEEEYGITRSKWVIEIKDLRLSDSGSYTCHVSNRYGYTSATFQLNVYDDSEIFADDDPVNTTVAVGQDAVLYCKVKADIAEPKVEWLKQITKSEYVNYVLENNSKTKSNDFIQSLSNPTQMDIGDFDESHYITVSSSTENTVLMDSNHTYLSRLIIKGATVKDSGVYLCLTVNQLSKAYSYRKAYLFVNGNNEEPVEGLNTNIKQTDTNLPKNIILTSFSMNFLIIVITVCISLSFLLLTIFILKSRKDNSKREKSINCNYDNINKPSQSLGVFGTILNKMGTIKRKYFTILCSKSKNLDSLSDNTETTSVNYSLTNKSSDSQLTGYIPATMHTNSTSNNPYLIPDNNKFKEVDNCGRTLIRPRTCYQLEETPASSIIYYKVIDSTKEQQQLRKSFDNTNKIEPLESSLYYQLNETDNST